MKAVKSSSPTLSPAESSASSALTQSDLKVLKGPFPRERLGVKVQSLSKNRDRAMLVLYLQHTDVQDRLEQIDPAWTSEVIAENERGDTVYIRMRMTVKGVSRENVGEGGDPKAAYSDALKRCAMLFGVGRYLYDSVTVWAPYDESRDRFKTWTVDDYEHAMKPSQKSDMVPIAPAEDAEPTAKPGLKTAKAAVRSREQLNRVLMNLYRPYLSKFPDTQFVELLKARYNVHETRLMTVEQIEDLVQFMEGRIEQAS